MTRTGLEGIKQRLHNGEQDEIIREWQLQKCYVSKEAIAENIRDRKASAYDVYKVFAEVADFVYPPNKEGLEDMESIKATLKPFFPTEVFSQSKWFDQGIPDYLSTHGQEVDIDQMFNLLWSALSKIGVDDKSIGIGWGAHLY